MPSSRKFQLLFLCTGNSCRSQMAEGWARHLLGDEFDVYSAGIETHGLNPFAVKVMAEAGVDISKHRSKNFNEFINTPLDFIITVCGHAHETCPIVPPKCKIIHQGFDDPPRLAKEFENLEDKLNCYRKVRDQIKEYVTTIPTIFNQMGES